MLSAKGPRPPIYHVHRLDCSCSPFFCAITSSFFKTTDTMSILEYFTRKDECQLPNSKRSRLNEADGDDDSSSAAEGDIDEPELTSHEGDSSVLTAESSSTESSTNRAKRKQASKFCNDWRKGREQWLKYLPGLGICFVLYARSIIRALLLVVLGTQPHAPGLDCRAFRSTKLVQLIRML